MDPGGAASEKLPALVWIYGGGAVTGSTAEPIYDGNAAAKKGVLVVSMNYRVHIFGRVRPPRTDAGIAASRLRGLRLSRPQ